MKDTSLEDRLIHEVWRQDLPAIRRLLAEGANPNLPGNGWRSAIACAGENDETGDIARVLVEAGANINVQDEFGQTPLHFAVDVAIDSACQANREDIDWTAVGAFLSLGADPSIRDQRGRTAFDFVVDYGPKTRASFEEFVRSRNTGE